jgi:hypothetical protein
MNTTDLARASQLAFPASEPIGGNVDPTVSTALVDSVTDEFSFALLLKTLRTIVPPTTKAIKTVKTVKTRLRSGILKPLRFLPVGFLWGDEFAIGRDVPGGRLGGEGTIGF